MVLRAVPSLVLKTSKDGNSVTSPSKLFPSLTVLVVKKGDTFLNSPSIQTEAKSRSKHAKTTPALNIPSNHLIFMGMNVTLFVTCFSHLTLCSEVQIMKHFSVDCHAFCLLECHQISVQICEATDKK